MDRIIPHRELRNNSSAVLREVQAGQRIQITNHGTVVATLVPPTDPAHGQTNPAQAPGDSAQPPLPARPAKLRGGFAQLYRTRAGESAQEALDDLRGDR